MLHDMHKQMADTEKMIDSAADSIVKIASAIFDSEDLSIENIQRSIDMTEKMIVTYEKMLVTMKSWNLAILDAEIKISVKQMVSNTCRILAKCDIMKAHLDSYLAAMKEEE